jgi:hypothetical protein
MNRDQFNRTEMFNTVAAYMDKNKSIFNGVKAVNDTLTEVTIGIAAIAQSARKQGAPTTGAADEKGQVRLSFQEKILEIADQLSAWADVQKDANLSAQVEFHPFQPGQAGR